jgi:hypothetical protein
VLQANCRRVYNKLLEFWNLFGTYIPDVVIGTESWLKLDISTVFFRADFRTSRRDSIPRDCWGFICDINIIASVELWVDVDFDMIAAEVKGMIPKYT